MRQPSPTDPWSRDVGQGRTSARNHFVQVHLQLLAHGINIPATPRTATDSIGRNYLESQPLLGLGRPWDTGIRPTATTLGKGCQLAASLYPCPQYMMLATWLERGKARSHETRERENPLRFSSSWSRETSAAIGYIAFHNIRKIGTNRTILTFWFSSSIHRLPRRFLATSRLSPPTAPH